MVYYVYYSALYYIIVYYIIARYVRQRITVIMCGCRGVCLSLSLSLSRSLFAVLSLLQRLLSSTCITLPSGLAFFLSALCMEIPVVYSRLTVSGCRTPCRNMLRIIVYNVMS